MTQQTIYPVDKCHFCDGKLEPNHISFAGLTDYFCGKKRCFKRFSYGVAYDDRKDLYYEISFEYNKYLFRFYLGSNITKIQHQSFKEDMKFDEIIKISSEEDILN
mgnify:CR=1 FL=1